MVCVGLVISHVKETAYLDNITCRMRNDSRGIGSSEFIDNNNNNSNNNMDKDKWKKEIRSSEKGNIKSYYY